MFLELQNIRKSFGEGENRVEVLKGINLSVEEGEVCVLLGPSGSGKSTLLNIIGGIDTADDGDIIVRGEQMRSMKEKLGGSSLQDIVRRAKALHRIEETYTNYSGIPEGVEGSVRFMIETEEIKAFKE